MKELEQLKVTIKEAGAAVLSFYGEDAGVTYKEKDNTPVTKADFASQDVLIRGLSGFGYPIISEELMDDKSRLKAQRVWVIDPLDGTRHFLQNDGEFCVMVALVEGDQSILGAIYVPTKKELYYAQKGGGAYVQNGNDKPVEIKVSSVSDPSMAKMLISKNHLQKDDIEFAKRQGIVNRIVCGSAGIKAMRVAAGEAEVYINSTDKTGEWDACASDIIITEAGGKMTDMDGQLLRYNKVSPNNQNGFIISNGKIKGI